MTQYICGRCDEKVDSTAIQAHDAEHAEWALKPHDFDGRSDPDDRYDNEWCALCGNPPDNSLHERTVIEYPSEGETYFRTEYGVYQYGIYPNSSVLHGQQKRSFLGSYGTLEEAQAAYPEAEWDGGASNRMPVHIPDNPPGWFDPLDAGESWSDD